MSARRKIKLLAEFAHSVVTKTDLGGKYYSKVTSFWKYLYPNLPYDLVQEYFWELDST